MPRIDDYINARNMGVAKLSQQPFDAILQRSGLACPGGSVFTIPFLDRVYRLSYPDFKFEDAADAAKEVPIQEQVLILHYLMGATDTPVTGRWVSYREIPGAAFYYSAFVKRAIDPLKKVFGNNLAGLPAAAAQLNGARIAAGDAGFEFRLLPRVAVQLVVWLGDDEFPPEANILFDESIGRIFSPEDVAWLAGMLVYRLIALAS